MKRIKREFSVARTPQQNRTAKRKNMTLIEAARTMVLVTKPHNKTLYELLHGRTPSIGFMRPFGCPVTILNTLDPLGSRPTWLFDIDTLTQSMNYQPVVAGNQPNSSADPQNTDANATFKVKEPKSEVHVSSSSSAKTRNMMTRLKERLNERVITNTFSVAGPSNTAVSLTLGKYLYVDPSQYPDDPDMPALDEITYLDNEEDVGVDDGFSNLETNITARFKDPDYPNKVYKVVKALYGLHQAPRTWYETFANYLLENGFKRGRIDQTLFIKKKKGDILLVQVYVDDIIFGSTNKDLCKAYEKLMKDKFQMSSMGELTFFLGLQVKQKKDEIFISQDKYVAELLKKFGLTDGKLASTPIDTEKPLLKDPDDEDVDVHTYRSMIGSLMYLTSSRPDIMFAVCACAFLSYSKSFTFA
nr:uncharacterized mitochondrial protein AtMg00810-like [Tanacetum cinerariifolium]